MAVRRGLAYPWANLALLLFVALELATGIAGLLGQSAPFRVVSWLHAVGAYAIVALLLFKGTLVLHVLRRRPGLSQERVVLGVMVALLLAVLITGLVWITAGRALFLGGTSVVNLHAYLAIGLCVLLAWHAVDRRWIVRVPAARDRAAFLRLAGIAAAGLVLWQVERTAQALLGAPGSKRRFTGSYEQGSFGGHFPATSWYDDDPEPVDAAAWRLVIEGEVGSALELTLADLAALGTERVVATIDCTGGWCSTQEWSGVPLAAALEAVSVGEEARSVEVVSVTGYARRFSLGDASRLLLATHVAGAPLSHGHGFPARLVVPDQRGFDWVKWVTRVRVLDSGPLWQSPLPLT
jgi:DMSO/TMAO reductase YedYZ molybdopterin-dependent catalytic subunit